MNFFLKLCLIGAIAIQLKADTSKPPIIIFPSESLNFIFGYDTNTQNIDIASTFLDIKFSNYGPTQGFDAVPEDTEFRITKAGVYEITYRALCKKRTGPVAHVSIRATVNENEIIGSRSIISLISNEEIGILSQTFLVRLKRRDIIKLQIASSSRGILLTSDVINRSVASVTITIRQIT